MILATLTNPLRSILKAERTSILGRGVREQRASGQRAHTVAHCETEEEEDKTQESSSPSTSANSRQGMPRLALVS